MDVDGDGSRDGGGGGSEAAGGTEAAAREEGGGGERGGEDGEARSKDTDTDKGKETKANLESMLTHVFYYLAQVSEPC